jgi:protein tyrosine phosphatase
MENYRSPLRCEISSDFKSLSSLSSLSSSNSKSLSSLSSSDEWQIIPDAPLYRKYPDLYSEALKPENRLKNRYSDILPLNDTRVTLPPRDSTDLNANDYINASYISVSENERFIACQAPLPQTFDDFWWMVWCEKCVVIGMFTNLVERNRSKADRYWPNLNDGMLFLEGKLMITNLREETNSNLIITVLELSFITNECSEPETRILRHCRYSGWPDFDAPSDTSEIESFIRDLPLFRRGYESSPVVVHCSAGCGRAGVVCAIYRNIQTHEPILETVRKLRTCRASMVQTKTQYKFIHTVINEWNRKTSAV